MSYFFFSSRRRHTRLQGDWSSDVCSSDLLVAIVGHDRLKQHLELLSNRIADREIPAQLRELVKQSFLGLLSERTSLTDPTVTDLFRNICENCDLGLSTLLRLAGSALLGQRDRMRRFFGERIKRITIKPFMDMDTMLEERLLQCCVHVGTQSDAQHQCAPFCAVQAWPALARQKPAARAGSAAPPPPPGGPPRPGGSLARPPPPPPPPPP